MPPLPTVISQPTKIQPCNLKKYYLLQACEGESNMTLHPITLIVKKSKAQTQPPEYCVIAVSKGDTNAKTPRIKREYTILSACKGDSSKFLQSIIQATGVDSVTQATPRKIQEQESVHLAQATIGSSYTTASTSNWNNSKF